MLFWIIIKVALRSLAANKLRSILAMLGIIFGVGAVIAMLAIGAGAQKQVADQIAAFGTNLIIVRPAPNGTGGVVSGTNQKLTLEDCLALRDVEGIKSVCPFVTGSCQLKHMGRNTRTGLIGSSVTFFPIRGFQIDNGRVFSETEAETSGRVIVLGPLTSDLLFAEEDPIGKVVKLNGINFTVVGIQKPKGDQGYYNPDDQAVIPYTTAMKQIFGVTFVYNIDLQAQENSDLSDVEDRINAVMRKRHKLQPEQPDDIQIRTPAEFLQNKAKRTQTFSVLLGSVASISLLVGGIGIMNIMLVTVTERTREIGVRKAIGAKERDILLQFVLEAIILCAVGGMIGVVAGVGGANGVGHFTDYPVVVHASSILLSVCVATIVGIFFGFYPALRASRLNPIEALRYE